MSNKWKNWLIGLGIGVAVGVLTALGGIALSASWPVVGAAAAGGAIAGALAYLKAKQPPIEE